MRAQIIYEDRFERGRNPKHTLNLGMANKIFQSCGKDFGDGGAWSFHYYGSENWMDIIKWLLDQGYNPEETEQVMRSKLMRWSSDKAGKSDRDCTLKDFINFNNELYKGKNQVDVFLDEYFPDSDRKNRIQHIDEDAIGGVSAPMATLNNTPGMGNAQPAAKASTGSLSGSSSTGSGDKFDASIGHINTQAPAKKITEENINPHDKLGVAMAKKMGIPLNFKKGKNGKDVEQIKIDEEKDMSTRLMTFDEWANKFSNKKIK